MVDPFNSMSIFVRPNMMMIPFGTSNGQAAMAQPSTSAAFRRGRGMPSAPMKKVKPS